MASFKMQGYTRVDLLIIILVKILLVINYIYFVHLIESNAKKTGKTIIMNELSQDKNRSNKENV